MRATQVSLMRAGTAVSDGSAVSSSGNFGPEVVVRHLLGLDAKRRGVAAANEPTRAMQRAC